DLLQSHGFGFMTGCQLLNAGSSTHCTFQSHMVYPLIIGENMYQSSQNFLDRLAYSLVALFALERILKLAAVIHFFRRHHPSRPASWPTVTLLQPITRGASNLAEAL